MELLSFLVEALILLLTITNVFNEYGSSFR